MTNLPKRDLAAVRTWAKESRRQESDRGRVPEGVIEAYDAAH
ncbi:histone-like nucleoid-structuring protein Lsr2 [Microbacterium sp.]